MQYKQITFDDLEEIRKKVCTKCQIEKPLKDFYRHSITKSGKSNQCKICINESQKEYNKNNRKKIKEYKKEYYQNNKEKVIKKSKEYYQNNKEKHRQYYKEYRKNNKEKIRKREKEYYQNTKEKRQEYKKEYYQNNKEKRREYFNERYKTDVNFKLAYKLRSRIKKAIKNNSKKSSTLELLGCSIEKVKEHLESQFQEGMTWDNHSYDGWHIDHIKPCASFDLSDPEQQKECFHYTNLQPLWAEENLSKGAKIHEV